MIGPLFALLSLFLCSQALPTIQVVGSKFYTSTQQQFFLKGMAYQLTPDDPLLNATQCQNDFSAMAAIGINSIRVYHVNPYISHDECMQIMSNYGIYLLVDLDTFNSTIVSYNATGTWNWAQLSAFEHVIDAFAKYNNTLGFFAGNEVVDDPDSSVSSPYIKAAVRDSKAYIKAAGYRSIPVGYAAADISQIRPAFQNYLVCADGSTNDLSSAIDFFGLNIYEWCGSSTYETSGYLARTQEVQNYPVPVFFSEFGCNTVQPRQFLDIPVLYGPNMSQVWSGGIVYEWIQEENDYGVITEVNGSPSPLADYYVLSTKWASVSPSSTPYSSYVQTNTYPTCPSSTSGGFAAATSVAARPSNDGTGYQGVVQLAALGVSQNTLSSQTSAGSVAVSGARTSTTKVTTTTGASASTKAASATAASTSTTTKSSASSTSFGLASALFTAFCSIVTFLAL